MNRISKLIALVLAAALLTSTAGAYAQEDGMWEARRAAARRLNPQGIVLARADNAMPVDLYKDLAGVGPVTSSIADFVQKTAPVKSGNDLAGLVKAVSPYGFVRQLPAHSNGPLIVHIQDLHGNEGAQENIAQIIKALQEEKGIDLVGIEGASGAFAEQDFRLFPSRQVKENIARFFLQKDLIGGAELAALTAEKPLNLWGLEDMALYRQNADAARRSVAGRAEAEGWMAALESGLAARRSSLYSTDLKVFDELRAKHEGNTLGLGDYVSALAALKHAPLAPNLRIFLEAVEEEKKLDFKAVENERKILARQLAEGLSAIQVRDLVAQSLEFRAGRRTQAEYNAILTGFCGTAKIDLAKFALFNRYIAYTGSVEKIQRERLLGEFTALEKAVQESLAETAEQKRLVALDQDTRLLRRLVRNEMTPEDWQTYSVARERILTVHDRIASLPGPTLQKPADWATKLAPFEAFCRLALARNEALEGGLLAKMAKTNSRSAILVTGGFHTPDLAALAAKRGAAFVVVSPKVGQVDAATNYLDAFAQEPLPLEKIFAGEAISLLKERLTFNPNGSVASDALYQGALAASLTEAAGDQTGRTKNEILADLGGALDRLKAAVGNRLSNMNPQISWVKGLLQVAFNVRGRQSVLRVNVSSDGAGITAIAGARSVADVVRAGAAWVRQQDMARITLWIGFALASLLFTIVHFGLWPDIWGSVLHLDRVSSAVGGVWAASVAAGIIKPLSQKDYWALEVPIAEKLEAALAAKDLETAASLVSEITELNRAYNKGHYSPLDLSDEGLFALQHYYTDYLKLRADAFSQATHKMDSDNLRLSFPAPTQRQGRDSSLIRVDRSALSFGRSGDDIEFYFPDSAPQILDQVGFSLAYRGGQSAVFPANKVPLDFTAVFTVALNGVDPGRIDLTLHSKGSIVEIISPYASLTGEAKAPVKEAAVVRLKRLEGQEVAVGGRTITVLGDWEIKKDVPVQVLVEKETQEGTNLVTLLTTQVRTPGGKTVPGYIEIWPDGTFRLQGAFAEGANPHVRKNPADKGERANRPKGPSLQHVRLSNGFLTLTHGWHKSPRTFLTQWSEKSFQASAPEGMPRPDVFDWVKKAPEKFKALGLRREVKDGKERLFAEHGDRTFLVAEVDEEDPDFATHSALIPAGEAGYLWPFEGPVTFITPEGLTDDLASARKSTRGGDVRSLFGDVLEQGVFYPLLVAAAAHRAVAEAAAHVLKKWGISADEFSFSPLGELLGKAVSGGFQMELVRALIQALPFTEQEVEPAHLAAVDRVLERLRAAIPGFNDVRVEILRETPPASVKMRADHLMGFDMVDGKLRVFIHAEVLRANADRLDQFLTAGLLHEYLEPMLGHDAVEALGFSAENRTEEIESLIGRAGQVAEAHETLAAQLGETLAAGTAAQILKGLESQIHTAVVRGSPENYETLRNALNQAGATVPPDSLAELAVINALEAVEHKTGAFTAEVPRAIVNQANEAARHAGLASLLPMAWAALPQHLGERVVGLPLSGESSVTLTEAQKAALAQEIKSAIAMADSEFRRTDRLVLLYSPDQTITRQGLADQLQGHLSPAERQWLIGDRKGILLHQATGPQFANGRYVALAIQENLKLRTPSFAGDEDNFDLRGTLEKVIPIYRLAQAIQTYLDQQTFLAIQA